MQISANVILDFRNELVAYAKSLQTEALSVSPVNSAMADALGGIAEEIELAPSNSTNMNTICEKYIQIFADDMKIKGADRYLAARIAKEMVPKVLADVMLEIED